MTKKKATKPPTPGEIIAGLREAKGWTCYRLAQECGLAQIQIDRIEAGAGLHLETARKIAQALGVSLAVFDLPEEKITPE